MVFGLGNSNYKFYDRVAEGLAQALQSMGAEMLAPLGLADDANGATQEDFVAWQEDFFKFLQEKLRYEERAGEYDPAFRVQEEESLVHNGLHHGEPPGKGKFEAPKVVSLSASRVLSATRDKTTLHLDIDISCQPQMHYRTGDYLLVWPMNPEAEVDKLLHISGLYDRRQVPISIKALDPRSS